jgi:hypothetical protein
MLATRRDVTNEIEVELVVERRVDCVRRDDLEKRVAIGRRPDDRIDGEIAGSTRPVLDNEGLAEPLRQPLPRQARDDVSRAARRKANNDAHRTRWIGFRPRDARHCRERGSARCQMQKSTAGKFHGACSLKVCDEADYSALMFAALMMGHHFSISAL